MFPFFPSSNLPAKSNVAPHRVARAFEQLGASKFHIFSKSLSLSVCLRLSFYFLPRLNSLSLVGHSEKDLLVKELNYFLGPSSGKILIEIVSIRHSVRDVLIS